MSRIPQAEVFYSLARTGGHGQDLTVANILWSSVVTGKWTAGPKVPKCIGRVTENTGSDSLSGFRPPKKCQREYSGQHQRSQDCRSYGPCRLVDFLGRVVGKEGIRLAARLHRRRN